MHLSRGVYVAQLTGTTRACIRMQIEPVYNRDQTKWCVREWYFGWLVIPSGAERLPRANQQLSNVRSRHDWRIAHADSRDAFPLLEPAKREQRRCALVARK